MMDFGESVVFTSKVNAGRLRLRKDQIDVILEIKGTYSEAPYSQIAMRNKDAFNIQETYDQVESLLGRN